VSQAHPATDPTLAALADRLMALGTHLNGLVAEVAARHGLTGAQAALLRSLDRPRPMRAVADHLRCDPSNVTGLIDRIEARGLVERTPDPADRRVRLLALTERGRAVRAGLEAELVVQVASASTLGPDEAAGLLALLDRIRLGGTPGCVVAEPPGS
jgi:DNA-binding MarR family transcriptional regulator